MRGYMRILQKWWWQKLRQNAAQQHEICTKKQKTVFSCISVFKKLLHRWLKQNCCPLLSSFLEIGKVTKVFFSLILWITNFVTEPDPKLFCVTLLQDRWSSESSSYSNEWYCHNFCSHKEHACGSVLGVKWKHTLWYFMNQQCLLYTGTRGLFLAFNKELCYSLE